MAGCFFSLSNAQTVAELDPAQTYSTGNIVVPTTPESGSTWTGAVYQDSLTCWGWGYPGYCGPNAIVRPGDAINFSYGSVYVYQEQLLSTLIPSGTGLQIRGYDFSFMAKNGNGWDDGRTDQLTALVRLWDTTNSKGINNLVYGNSWNLSYKFDWTHFTFSETFASPYDASTIGRVQYGFIGKDNNGWAGPYGPEIYSISFNIRYGVDPCAVNILSSPSCEGYLEYIASLSSTPTVETTISPITAANESTTSETAGSPIVPQTASSNEQNNSTATTAAVSSTVQTTTADNDRNSDKKSGPSLSLIQSIVGGELNRINQLESKTVSETTAQAQAASDSSAAQAESVAGSAQNQSIIGSVEQGQVSAANNSNQSQSSAQVSQSSAASLSQQNRSQSQLSAQTETAATESQSSISNQSQFSQSSQTLSESQTQTEIVQQVDDRTQDTATDNNITASGDVPINPIYSLLPPLPAVVDTDSQKDDSRSSVLSHTPRAEDSAERVSTTEESSPATGPTVRNGGTVEGMGGGNIAALAQSPAGFDSYLTQNIADAQFYSPREIYRGQVNVDNARALRQLGTDRLHKEMVDQQYNIGAK